MVRKKLEGKVGHLSNAEFAIICEMVSDDLKFNRVNFGKCTSLNYVINIAVSCSVVFRRLA